MYPVGEETGPNPFPVTGNGHRRVTEPKGDRFSGRILGMTPSHLSTERIIITAYKEKHV